MFPMMYMVKKQKQIRHDKFLTYSFNSIKMKLGNMIEKMKTDIYEGMRYCIVMQVIPVFVRHPNNFFLIRITIIVTMINC